MSSATPEPPQPAASPATVSNVSRLRLIISVVGSSILLAGVLLFILFQPPGTGATNTIITVQAGTSATRVANDLYKHGLVRSARLFSLYARLSGTSADIKAGPYQFSDNMSPAEILRKLVNGDIYVWRFAVPEGYSLFQLAELLAARNIVTKEAFLAASTDPALRQELAVPGPSVEGYLYPSTYDIPPGSDAPAIIRQMVHQFDREFTIQFAGQLKERGLTRHQVVTLASLVEKEAVAPEERPLIAAVFLNRLQKRMRLQSDPTAVYGRRAFGGTVSAQEVRQATPYNTYVIPGLPPGPIGNPSSAALAAVLAPAAVPHLYFVAKKDGTHHFSATLTEHNQAVTKYLKSGSR